MTNTDANDAEIEYNVITDADALDDVRDDLDGDHVLGGDVDLDGFSENEGWQPVGDDDNPFTGRFDGLGNTVSNLTIDRDEDEVGLFGHAENASFRHLRLQDIDVTGHENTGGLVGYWRVTDSTVMEGIQMTGRVTGGGGLNVAGLIGHAETEGGEEGAELVITRIHIDGDVDSIYDGVRSGGRVGGLAGEIRVDDPNDQLTLNRSLVAGSVTGTNVYTGGAVGSLRLEGKRLRMDEVQTSTSVTGTGDAGGIVGVFALYDEAEAEMTRIRASGDVDYQAGNDEGQKLGGLIGSALLTGDEGSSFTLEDAHATGDVSGTKHVGGLVGRWGGLVTRPSSLANAGHTDSVLKNVHASGTVSGEQDVGGLIGLADGSYASGAFSVEIQDAYATGEIEADTNAGGLIGQLSGYLDEEDDKVGGSFSVDIGNTYATGAVAADSRAGGLIGYLNGEGAEDPVSVDIRNVYATGAVAADDHAGGLIGHLNGERAEDSFSVEIQDAYASNTVAGVEDLGGLVGRVGSEYDSQFTVSQAFYDRETNPDEAMGDAEAYGASRAEIRNALDDVEGWAMEDVEDSISYEGYRLGLLPYLAGVTTEAHAAELPTARLFAGGWGDAENGGAYTIETPYQLQHINEVIGESFDYELHADLDLASEPNWQPIGDNATPFQGRFDGQGNTISNLTIDRPDESDVGLFGSARNATLLDFELETVDVTGDSRVGSLIGHARAADGGMMTVSGIEATGKVAGSELQGGLVGGVQASADGEEGAAVTLEDLHADVDVTGMGTGTGGLVGSAWIDDEAALGITLKDVSAAGVVTAGDDFEEVGGLMGSAEARQAGNEISISDARATGQVEGHGKVGGLVGYAYGRSGAELHLARAHAEGDVEGVGDWIGGLVGVLEEGHSVAGESSDTGKVTLEEVSAAGDVTRGGHGGGAGGTGGLLGRASIYDGVALKIIDAEAIGDVSSEGDNVGGLIGYATAQDGAELVIRNAQASGEVKVTGAGSATGGLVGFAYSIDGGELEIRNAQASGEVTGAGNATGGLVGGTSASDSGSLVIRNVQASGAVTGARWGTGGLVGSAYSIDGGDLVIEGARAIGNVTIDTVNDPGPVGGLVGLAENSTIRESEASGTVSSEGVSGDDVVPTGGLVGEAVNTGIEHSYATGPVSGGESSLAGGLVGNADNGSVIEDAYASNTVTVAEDGTAGGLVGTDGDVTVDNAFYDAETNTDASMADAAEHGAARQEIRNALEGHDAWTAGAYDGDGADHEGYRIGRLPHLTEVSTEAQIEALPHATLFAGGWGDADGDGAYTIETPTQLQSINEVVGEGFDYELITDLDLASESNWQPIGDDGTPFQGHFDGRGNTISNLTIDRPDESHVGLFGSARNATLQDVMLEAVDVTGESRVGGLVGSAEAADGADLAIRDVAVSGQVTGSSWGGGGILGEANAVGEGDLTIRDIVVDAEVDAPSLAGGVLGYAGAESGTTLEITNVDAEGAVSGASDIGGLAGHISADSDADVGIEDARASGNVTGEDWIGGLAGYVGGVTIDRADARGDVTIDSLNALEPVGGLVGLAEDSTIRESQASGAVSSEAVPGDAVVPTGGLVGEAVNTGIEHSYATGPVSGGAASLAGGLVGNADGATLNQVFATGDVTAADGAIAGGLAGSAEASSIEQAYATGEVTVGDGEEAYAGGFVGRLAGDATVDEAYSTGSVQAGTDAGLNGFAGHQEGEGNAIQASYWDVDTSGVGDDGDDNHGATGRTTEALQDRDTFAGWSMSTEAGGETAWRLYEGAAHPLLRAFFKDEATIEFSLDESRAYDGSDVVELGADTPWRVDADVDEALISVEDLALVLASANVGDQDVQRILGVSSEQHGYDLDIQGLDQYTIDPRELTLEGEFDVADKAYDGTTDATITDAGGLTLVNLADGEDLDLENLAAVFADANAGEAVQVDLTDAELADGDQGQASNYTLDASGWPTTTAEIAPRELTLDGEFEVTDRTYDGTVDAEIEGSPDLTLGNLVDGEDLELGDVEAEFADPNAGEAVEVRLSEAPLEDGDNGSATNYVVPQAARPTTTAEIARREVTLGGEFAVEDKAYDGTTDATITDADGLTLDNLVAGETLALSGLQAAFAQADPGEGIEVGLTSAELADGDTGQASNYMLSANGWPVTEASIMESEPDPVEAEDGSGDTGQVDRDVSEQTTADIREVENGDPESGTPDSKITANSGSGLVDALFAAQLVIDERGFGSLLGVVDESGDLSGR